MKAHIGALLLFVLLLLVAPGVSAEEVITSFESEISIQADSTMKVSETISVVAEGNQIKRGIYRDFPTTYTDTLGNNYKVGFEVTRVRRDGVDEPYHQEDQSNGVRVYIGRSDVFLRAGTYRYQIDYETNRQLGFFEKHDELYWNVTGNGWVFPIERASARIKLPGGAAGNAATNKLSVEGYTGAQGSKARDYEAGADGAEAWIKTTRRLGANEGLTVVVQFPKGIVRKPSESEEFGYYIRDNLGSALQLLALVLGALYLVVAWGIVGRDPNAGIVYARYEPPAGYSPSAAHFISHMSYDDVTFSAALVNLAVQGHLRIVEHGKTYELVKESSAAPMAPGEAALFNSLLGSRASIQVKDSKHSVFENARAAHEEALERDYLAVYFKKNAGFIFPSVALTLVLLGVGVVTNSLSLTSFLILAANVVMHVLFLNWLRAPTRRGRLLLDELDGFALYLRVAEKDDLGKRHPPEKTPQLFEKYLPYAIALGVENEWEKQFTSTFAALSGDEGGGYQPRWYHGTRVGAAGFSTALSENFVSAISSASSPPAQSGSSGGGGGGSSGGGGGGGGGGAGNYNSLRLPPQSIR